MSSGNTIVETVMISRAIKQLLIFLLTGLRPLLGPATCRFAVGCTAYAKEQLATQPLHYALWRIGKRLLACNPFWPLRS